jgi:hypothetical protein
MNEGEMPEERLTVQERQEIFRALVELQDEGRETVESRNQIAAQFSVDVDEVQDIEREGIAKQWAPL